MHLACVPGITANDSTNDFQNRWICTNCSSSIFPFNHFDSENLFLEAISEFRLSVPFDRLLDNQFNPFELNNDSTHLPFIDTDPDLQYFNDTTYLNTLMNCDYFLEDSFLKKCENNQVTNENFSIIHSNIRSTSKNFDNFKLYLDTIGFEFTFIGLSETWLTPLNAENYGIEGYSHEYLCREGKKGGGISLYIKDNINFINRKDLNVMESHIEALFIEITKEENNISKNCLICVVYRPPNNDVNLFTNSLSEIIQKYDLSNNSIYIMGDFNINLLNIDNHLPSSEFIENLYSYGIFPLINKPTRVTDNSTTLIDNIFSNEVLNENMINGIFYTKITDHFPVFSINCSKVIEKPKFFRKTRFYSEKNIALFKQKINANNFEDVSQILDGKHAFDTFTKNFACFMRNVFPLNMLNRDTRTKKFG